MREFILNWKIDILYGFIGFGIHVSKQTIINETVHVISTLIAGLLLIVCSHFLRKWLKSK